VTTESTQAEWPDPAIVAADVYKLLLENDRVRLFEVRFKPGQQAVMHRHPDHLVYVLTDYTLDLSVPGSASQVIALKAGEAVWMKAGPHAAKNIGATEGRALVIELKER
jgi:quercetin dioxygenase-like cupin family protein